MNNLCASVVSACHRCCMEGGSKLEVMGGAGTDVGTIIAGL